MRPKNLHKDLPLSLLDLFLFVALQSAGENILKATNFLSILDVLFFFNFDFFPPKTERELGT
jgi:hypothetical protein